MIANYEVLILTTYTTYTIIFNMQTVQSINWCIGFAMFLNWENTKTRCWNHQHNYWSLQIIFHLNKHFLQTEAKSNCYSLIAFDERVTFWLQRVRSLPCACANVAFFARRLAYNHYAFAHAYNAANTHVQGSDPARWNQKVTLLSKAIGV